MKLCWCLNKQQAIPITTCLSDSMFIATFKSVGKAYVDRQWDFDWATMSELLTTHHDVAAKDQAPLYNLGEFKTLDDPTVELGRRHDYRDGVRQETWTEIPRTVRRCKANLLSISGIVLDFDGGVSFDSVRDQYAGLEFVMYSTFRHLATDPPQDKFRLVIPFAQPLLAADIPGRKVSVESLFPTVDAASFTMSQSFYMHSGEHPRLHHGRGHMIDPYRDFVEQPVVVWQPTTVPVTTTMSQQQQAAYRSAVLTSLRTCQNLHYHSDRSRLGVLTLVSICRSIGASFEEFDSVCVQIAADNSSLQQTQLRRNAWTGWTGDRIKRETRDRFIRDHGGTPVQPIRISHTDRQEQFQHSMQEIEQLKNIIEQRKQHG